MYVTQDIITELIKQIDTAMAAVNVNVHGNGIAVKDTAGQVVSLNVTQNGHRNYVGITDTARTGYYIRVNGIVSETRKAANTKRGSCGIELDVRIPFILKISAKINKISARLKLFASGNVIRNAENRHLKFSLKSIKKSTI